MTHVAIVLPGRSYGADLPSIAIPVDVLRNRGAEVVTVEYPPAPWPDWTRAEAGDWSEVTQAVLPQIEPALTRASRVTVVAKSMGTSVIGGLIPTLGNVAEVIWITPLFGMAEVRDAAITAGWRTLSVFGTADPQHDPLGQRAVTAAVGGFELALVGGNHSLVIEGDPEATETGFASLRQAVEDFL